jgi:copper chaperone CopZ
MQTVEKALRDVPGVMRAYVNPATEAAYVEYDADRCSEADIEGAVASAGVHAVHSPRPRRAAAVPFSFSSERLPMSKTVARSRTWWAFAGFVAIAAFFLTTEHRAHLFGILPFLFLAACLSLHMFGHGGTAVMVEAVT